MDRFLYENYNGNLSYKNGDYVLFAGVVYICVQDAGKHQSPRTNPTLWVRAFGGSLGAVVISAGTQLATTGTIVFSNSNGISFGLSNSSILTASVGAGAALINFSAGTTSSNLGSVVFSNSNGLSFGLNNSTITGSYTVPSTAGLLSAINISGGTTSNNLSNLVFSNSNGLAFGLNGSTLTGSYTVPVVTNSSWTVSAGTTSGTVSQLIFSNSNGLTFGLNAGTITGSYTVPVVPPETPFALSAGTQSVSTGTVIFSNSNGISFGMAGSNTVTASYTVPTQSNQTVGLYMSSNTTSSVSSGTVDARSMTFRGMGIASVGYSAGEVVISVPAGGGGISAINVSAGTTSLNLSAITFEDSHGVSFGLDGSTITASVRAGTSLAFTLGGNIATTNSSQILSGGYILAGGNGVTIQQSNNSVSLSVATNYQSQGAYLTTAAQSTQTFVASLGGNTGTTNSSIIGNGAFVFAGGNGVTINQSNNSVSWSVATAYQSQGAYLTTARASNDAIGLNTAQTNVTWTVNSSGLSFNAGGYAGTNTATTGAISVTLNTSGISLNIGAYLTTAALSNHSHGNPTLNLTNLSGTTASASNGFTLSLSAAAAGGGATLSWFDHPRWGVILGPTPQAIGNLYIQPVVFPQNMSAATVDLLYVVNLTSSAVTNTTYRGTFTLSAGLYSLNAGTLSLITGSSGSQSFSYSYTSNVSTSNLSSLRKFTIPMNVNATPGNYWYGINFSFAAGTGSISLTPLVGSSVITSWVGLWGAAPNSSNQVVPYGGIYSTTTGAFPANISVSQVYAGLGNVTLRAIQPIYIGFRNISTAV